MPEIIWWPHFTVGAALCLGGWALYWVGLHLAGATGGGAAAAALAWGIVALAEIEPARAAWIIPAAGIAGAAAGVFLIRKLHRFSFFLIGAVMGMGVAWTGFDWSITVGKDYLDRMGWAMDPGIWRTVWVIAGSLAGGAIMVVGSKWIIAAIASLSGAMLVALSIRDPLALAAIIPVAGASFFFQIGLLRRLSRRKKSAPEEKSSKD